MLRLAFNFAQNSAMRHLKYTLLLFLFACIGSLHAQHLTGVRNIHPADTGLLTAGALDEAGNFYAASTLNLKTLPGESGIAGIFPAGDPVLSKFAADGTLLWRHEFPGNVARISDIAVTPDQNLVITGGYVDTFRLAADWGVPGEASNGSFFIAQVDPEGNFMWMDTDVSTLPEDCIGWTLAVGPTEIYVAGMHEGIYSSLRRYSFSGALQAEIIVDIRTISDLMLDEQGMLYAVGTASPFAFFNNLPVPSPPELTGYVNYIAQLDSVFQVQWIRSTNYITFDEHPKGALFNRHPLLLSNDFGAQNNQGAYRLKEYSVEGDLLHTDSILSGFFFQNYEHFALQPFCDRLLLAYPSEGGFALKSFDAEFQDTVLLQTSDGNFSSSIPFISTHGEHAVLGSSFRNAELTIASGFDELHNSKTPDPQEFILVLECEETSSGSEDISQAPALWNLTPNPAGAVVYLNRKNENDVQEVFLELLDAQGRSCRYEKSSEHQIAISVETIPAGIYFLRVTGKTGTVMLKGIKQ